MTKNEDILKPFEVIERQTLEVENVVEKNKYFTILFFSQLYTQLDTCKIFHPCNARSNKNRRGVQDVKEYLYSQCQDWFEFGNVPEHNEHNHMSKGINRS